MKKLTILLALPFLLLTACNRQQEEMMDNDSTMPADDEMIEAEGEVTETMEMEGEMTEELSEEMKELLDAGDQGLASAMEAVDVLEGL